MAVVWIMVLVFIVVLFVAGSGLLRYFRGIMRLRLSGCRGRNRGAITADRPPVHSCYLSRFEPLTSAAAAEQGEEAEAAEEGGAGLGDLGQDKAT